MSEPAFRLAMRAEGNDWIAYLAAPKTMVGARELARINMTLAQDTRIKEKFQDFCIEAMKIVMSDLGVKATHWDIKDAPEHERAGRA